jgi:hypothetical protein
MMAPEPVGRQTRVSRRRRRPRRRKGSRRSGSGRRRRRRRRRRRSWRRRGGPRSARRSKEQGATPRRIAGGEDSGVSTGAAAGRAGGCGGGRGGGGADGEGQGAAHQEGAVDRRPGPVSGRAAVPRCCRWRWTEDKLSDVEGKLSHVEGKLWRRRWWRCGPSSTRCVGKGLGGQSGAADRMYSVLYLAAVFCFCCFGDTFPVDLACVVAYFLYKSLLRKTPAKDCC